MDCINTPILYDWLHYKDDKVKISHTASLRCRIESYYYYYFNVLVLLLLLPTRINFLSASKLFSLSLSLSHPLLFSHPLSFSHSLFFSLSATCEVNYISHILLFLNHSLTTFILLNQQLWITCHVLVFVARFLSSFWRVAQYTQQTGHRKSHQVV